MNLIPDTLFDTEQFFSNWLGGKGLSRRDASTAFSPRVDVHDKKDKYLIIADLPGVDKDDINISLHNGLLTLQAKAQEESSDEKDGEIVRRERFYGNYLRRFDLGNNLHESDVRAEFKNGVLSLVIPKLERREPEVRKIEIQ
jgi:HSP20 family protein